MQHDYGIEQDWLDCMAKARERLDMSQEAIIEIGSGLEIESTGETGDGKNASDKDDHQETGGSTVTLDCDVRSS